MMSKTKRTFNLAAALQARADEAALGQSDSESDGLEESKQLVKTKGRQQDVPMAILKDKNYVKMVKEKKARKTAKQAEK